MLPGFTGFSRGSKKVFFCDYILKSLVFWWVSPGFSTTPMDLTGFYWVFSGSNGRYWVLPGFQ